LAVVVHAIIFGRVKESSRQLDSARGITLR